MGSLCGGRARCKAPLRPHRSHVFFFNPPTEKKFTQSSAPLAIKDVTLKVGDVALSASPPAALDAPLALGQEEALKVRGTSFFFFHAARSLCAPQPFPPALLHHHHSPPTNTTHSRTQIEMVVTAGGRPASPLQVGALFRHRATRASAFIPGAKRGAAGSGKHAVEVSPAGLALQLGLAPDAPGAWGAFDLQVLVGDAGGAEPYVWTAGRVDVSEPAAPEEGSAPSPAAAAASAARPPLGPLPDFDHVRRPPARRAPASFAIAASGVVLLPLFGLGVALHRTGALALRGLPASGAPLAAAAAFHACLAAGLGLALLFWTRLNLVQTLPLAGGLGLVTLVVGHRALSQHAAKRGSGAAKKAE
jgi:hypothetical protein